MKARIVTVLMLLVVGGLAIAASQPILVTSGSVDGAAIAPASITTNSVSPITAASGWDAIGLHEAYREDMTSNADPYNMSITASSAYAQASTAGYKVGGDQVIASGTGSSLYEVKANTAITATITVNHETAVALVGGTAFTLGATNDVAGWTAEALSLANAINAHATLGTYLTATASTVYVYVQPKENCYYLLLATSLTATLTVTQAAPGTMGVYGQVRLGKPGAGPGTATANGDVYVGGTLEVDGATDLSGTVSVSGSSSYVQAYLGFRATDDRGYGGPATTSQRAMFYPSLTAHTPDTGAIATGSLANSLLLMETGDTGYDWSANGGVAFTDPTLVIMGKTQQANSGLALSYNDVAGVISTRAGNINLTPASGLVTINNDLGPSVSAVATDAAPVITIVTTEEPFANVALADQTNKTGGNLGLIPANGSRRLASAGADMCVGADPCAVANGTTITFPTQTDGVVTNCVITHAAAESAASREFHCNGHTPAECGASIIVAMSTVSPCTLINKTAATNGVLGFSRVAGSISYLGPIVVSTGATEIVAENGTDGKIVVPSGTSTVPSIFPPGDTDTGISFGTDIVNLITGGGRHFFCDTARCYVTHNLEVGANIQSSDLDLTGATMSESDNNGKIRGGTNKFSWTNAMVVALGANLTGDITVATLPAKTRIKNAYVVINTACTGAVDTLTVSVGTVAADYIDIITAQDAKAAANTVYGDASAERGTNLTGYWMPSYTATQLVTAHFVATDGGTDKLDSVLTCTGSVILETEAVL